METALGRALDDDEIFQHIDEDEDKGDGDEGPGGAQEQCNEVEEQKEQKEEQNMESRTIEAEKEGQKEEKNTETEADEAERETKPLVFDEWVAEKCQSMKYLPNRGQATCALLLVGAMMRVVTFGSVTF